MRWVLAAAAIVASGLANAQSTTTYEYDALGRLVATTSTVGSGTARTSITHDAAGNRTAYKVTASPSGSPSPTPTPTPTPTPAPTPTPTPTPTPSPGPSPASQQFVIVPLNGFTLIPVG